MHHSALSFSWLFVALFLALSGTDALASRRRPPSIKKRAVKQTVPVIAPDVVSMADEVVVPSVTPSDDGAARTSAGESPGGGTPPTGSGDGSDGGNGAAKGPPGGAVVESIEPKIIEVAQDLKAALDEGTRYVPNLKITVSPPPSTIASRVLYLHGDAYQPWPGSGISVTFQSVYSPLSVQVPLAAAVVAHPSGHVLEAGTQVEKLFFGISTGCNAFNGEHHSIDFVASILLTIEDYTLAGGTKLLAGHILPGSFKYEIRPFGQPGGQAYHPSEPSLCALPVAGWAYPTNTVYEVNDPFLVYRNPDGAALLAYTVVRNPATQCGDLGAVQLNRFGDVLHGTRNDAWLSTEGSFCDRSIGLAGASRGTASPALTGGERFVNFDSAGYALRIPVIPGNFASLDTSLIEILPGFTHLNPAFNGAPPQFKYVADRAVLDLETPDHLPGLILFGDDTNTRPSVAVPLTIKAKVGAASGTSGAEVSMTTPDPYYNSGQGSPNLSCRGDLWGAGITGSASAADGIVVSIWHAVKPPLLKFQTPGCSIVE